MRFLPRLFLAVGIMFMVQSSAAPAASRRDFRTSDGVRLSFLETGPAKKNGLTIALVTGWLMPGEIWRSQLDSIGQSYQTVALDPRGQGESDIPSNGYTAERRATDVKEFLDPYANVLLVGWSLGAIEALQYIHMFGAQRLAGLVLVDSSVGEAPAPKEEGSFLKALRDDRDKNLDAFVRAIFKRPRSEGELMRLAKGAKQMSVENSIALLSYPFPRSHWREIVGRFPRPLLYAVTPQFAEQAANLQKHRKGTEVAIFRNAGHALFVDEPERFNSLIKKFAARLSTRR